MAKRNYRFFTLFLNVVTGLLAVGIIVSIIQLFILIIRIRDSNVASPTTEIIGCILVGIMTLYMIVVFIFGAIMCGYHTLLIFNNQTTYERVFVRSVRLLTFSRFDVLKTRIQMVY